MKILLVADWHGEIYAEALFRGFQQLDVKVHKFSWKEYFHQYPYLSAKITGHAAKLSLLEKLKSICYRAQNKFIAGAIINKINSDLLKAVDTIKPDLIFIYRGTHIFPNTLQQIKSRWGALIFAYNNDDPFSVQYPFYVWRHYHGGLKYCDHIFAYRQKNIEDYHKAGYSNVSLLRAYYRPEENFPIENLPVNTYSCDVIFVGHFEKDGRDQILKCLLDNGVNLKIYGFAWEKSQWYHYFCQKSGKIVQLHEDYNLALNSAKIALVFLSKKNNDTYTRRCFEIPATRRMMLAERTGDLMSLFTEITEADYFSDAAECLQKVQYYLQQDRYKEIAAAGYQRLLKDGHAAVDRCKQILLTYHEVQKQ